MMIILMITIVYLILCISIMMTISQVQKGYASTILMCPGSRNPQALCRAWGNQVICCVSIPYMFTSTYIM